MADVVRNVLFLFNLGARLSGRRYLRGDDLRDRKRAQGIGVRPVLSAHSGNNTLDGFPARDSRSLELALAMGRLFALGVGRLVGEFAGHRT